MLALSKQSALEYSKAPYLAAFNTHPGKVKEIYVVPDNDLPAITPKEDPFDYLSKQELFELKKKYRVGKSVFQKIQNGFFQEQKF